MLDLWPSEVTLVRTRIDPLVLILNVACLPRLIESFLLSGFFPGLSTLTVIVFVSSSYEMSLASVFVLFTLAA